MADKQINNTNFILYWYFDESKLDLVREDGFIICDDLLEIMKKVADRHNKNTVDVIKVMEYNYISPNDKKFLDKLSKLDKINTKEELKERLRKPWYNCLTDILSDEDSKLYDELFG